MRLFGNAKLKESDRLPSISKGRYITIPEKIGKTNLILKLRNRELLSTNLQTLFTLGDVEDFITFSSVWGKNFFESEQREIEKIIADSQDDLERFVYLLNEFLIVNSMGFIQLSIDVESGDFIIKHYFSFLVGALENMESKGIDRACYFLEEFYSNVFSMLSGSEVKVKEANCAFQSKEDYCIFRKD